MAGVLIILVFLVMWMGSSISSSWHDQNHTFESRDNAKAQGRLTYHQYSKNGRIKQRVYAPTGTKGYELGGKFYDTKGRLVADIGRMQIDRANQVSMILSKQKGWDFYPYFTTMSLRADQPPYINDRFCYPCIDGTGKIFTWHDLGVREVKKSYRKLDDRGAPIDFTGWAETIDTGKLRARDFISEVNHVALEAYRSGRSIRV